MVAPIIWGGLAVAGVLGAGWAANEAGDAAESGAKLAKWVTVAGGLYVSYRALKASGALK